MLLNVAKEKLKVSQWIWKYLSSKENPDGHYYFILEGDYVCTKKQTTMLVLRARHQRNALIRPLQEIAHNNELIQTLSPIDAFLIGVLANKDQNGFKDIAYTSLANMRRLKNKHIAVKFNTILQITKTNFDESNHEILSIYSAEANKEMQLSITELFENKALLYGLDPMQALSLGYSVSEWWIRHQLIENLNHVE